MSGGRARDAERDGRAVSDVRVEVLDEHARVVDALLRLPANRIIRRKSFNQSHSLDHSLSFNVGFTYVILPIGKVNNTYTSANERYTTANTKVSLHISSVKHLHAKAPNSKFHNFGG